MTSIASQLKAIQKKSMMKAEAVYRESMFEVATRIIFRSPKDTGLFINNWLSAYEYDKSTHNVEDESGSKSFGTLTKKQSGLTLDRSFYFMNSLPYAERLENGWSQQAADGMVKRSLAEFDSIAQEVINKYK